MWNSMYPILITSMRMDSHLKHELKTLFYPLDISPIWSLQAAWQARLIGGVGGEMRKIASNWGRGREGEKEGMQSFNDTLFILWRLLLRSLLRQWWEGEQKKGEMSQLGLPCDYLSIWRWEGRRLRILCPHWGRLRVRGWLKGVRGCQEAWFGQKANNISHSVSLGVWNRQKKNSWLTNRASTCSLGHWR